MQRDWQEILPDSDTQDRAGPPSVRDGSDRTVQIYRLAEIRKEYARARQSDVAALMGVSQARVSKLERGDLSRTEVGTVASYITALGGSLRILAEFGEQRVELKT